MDEIFAKELITDFQSKYPVLTRFMQKVHDAGIPWKNLEVNDWECSGAPGVYIKNRTRPSQAKRYCRCSDKDVQYALRYFRKGEI